MPVLFQTLEGTLLFYNMFLNLYIFFMFPLAGMSKVQRIQGPNLLENVPSLAEQILAEQTQHP